MSDNRPLREQRFDLLAELRIVEESELFLLLEHPNVIEVIQFLAGLRKTFVVFGVRDGAHRLGLVEFRLLGIDLGLNELTLLKDLRVGKRLLEFVQLPSRAWAR